MLVGLNLLYLLPGEVGGTESYARGLLEGAASNPQGHRFVVFVNNQARDWALPDSPHIQRIQCQVDAKDRRGRYWFEQVHLPRKVAAAGIEVLHSAGYVGPIYAPCPHVITLHDVNFIGHGSAMRWRKRIALGAAIWVTTHACDHVITVSKFSRQEALRHLKLAPDKVTAVHSAAGLGLGAGNGQAVAGRRNTQPYILALGSQSPHKNLPRLVRAFHKIRDLIPHHLVIAGHEPNDKAFRNAMAECNISGRIDITGYVDDETLRRYMTSADLFVFPSLYEGFGLPVLEAQALGTAVICSSRASLPEVAGRGAAYFDPESEAEIAQTIIRVLHDDVVRRSLIAAGYENARMFSWKRTVQETLAVYQKVLAGGGRS